VPNSIATLAVFDNIDDVVTYIKRAHDFCNNFVEDNPRFFKRFLPGGDVAFLDKTTRELAIRRADGAMKTYYKIDPIYPDAEAYLNGLY
jgi:hypothetical protein